MTSEQELTVFFEARFDECSALATRVARSVVGTHADAEDIAQLAFIRAHRKLSTLRDPLKFRAWFARIVRRLALNNRRNARRRRDYEDAAARHSVRLCRQTPPPDMDEYTRIRSMINALPDGQRSAVVLAGVEGHTMRETAQRLGVPEGTVKTWLFRARKDLQGRLRRDLPPPTLRTRLS